MGDSTGRSILFKTESWITKVSNNTSGTKIVNPKDTGDYIRFTPKNPDPGALIGQQYDAFRRYKNGKALTKDGQWMNPKTHPNKQNFHIPQDMFEEMRPLLELD